VLSAVSSQFALPVEAGCLTDLIIYVGSIAAGIQSALYGGYVASGSAFALAQSAAAGGIIVSSVPVQAVSAGAMALGAWIGLGCPADRVVNNGTQGSEQGAQG
jgi:hypothetical protein